MSDTDRASPEEERSTVRRILLVDDHPIVREGLASLIEREPDLVVCGEAGDQVSALELLETDPPDLLLLDLVLPGGGGLAFLRQVRRRWPELPVLVVTMHGDAFHAERSLRMGADGFVSKADATQRLVEAIRMVLAGEVYLADEMAKDVIAKTIRGKPPAEAEAPPDDILSVRELEIFELIGVGHSSRRIAEDLGLSQKTVESHKENIKQKLALPDASALSHAAVRWIAAGQAP